MDVCVPRAEVVAAACSNGRDDDCDGTVDCRDLGCATYCVDAGPDVMCTRAAPRTPTALRQRRRRLRRLTSTAGGASGTLPDFDCTMNAAAVCPRDGGVFTPVACPRGTGTTTRRAQTASTFYDRDGYIDCGGANSPDFGCTMNAARPSVRVTAASPRPPPAPPTGRESERLWARRRQRPQRCTDCGRPQLLVHRRSPPFRMGCVLEAGAEAITRRAATRWTTTATASSTASTSTAPCRAPSPLPARRRAGLFSRGRRFTGPAKSVFTRHRPS